MFALRPYQAEAKAAVEAALREHDSTLLVLPTGTGKTEVFTSIIGDWQHGRSLVICPMVELVAQARSKILKRTGIDPAIEQAHNRSNESEWGRSEFVVASKQTLMAGKHSRRYKRFADIGFVVVDEAHMCATEEYAELLGHFREQGAKILGVTATPKRHDKRALGQLFKSQCYTYGIAEAVDDGWLVPSQVQCVRLKSLDLSTVATGNTTLGKDFNTKQLNDRLEDEHTIFEIADVTARETRGVKTAIYCSSVREAQGVAEKLRDSYGINAAWICSDKVKCSEDRRSEVMRGFVQGEITHLANVGMLTTGWDFPALQAIVQARPTQSTALYTQIYGRGTRPLDGVVDFEGSTPELRKAAIAASAKPHFRMIDLVDTSHNHRIVTAIDALGGRFTLVERQKAKEALKDGAPVELDQALLDARHALQREAEERERRRRAQIEARANYSLTNVNPVGTAPQGTVENRREKSGPVMLFGKHKGTPIKDLPRGYLEWFVGQLDAGKMKVKWWLEKAIREAHGGKSKPEPRANLSIDEINQLFLEASRS